METKSIFEILHEILTRIDQLEKDRGVPVSSPHPLPVAFRQQPPPSIQVRRQLYRAAEAQGVIPANRSLNPQRYDFYARLRQELGL